MQEEDDLFAQDLNECIDRWENESIRNIQIIAQTTRDNLRLLMHKSRERFFKAYADLMNNFRSCYDEIYHKLNQWMDQLKQLQADILSPRYSIIPDRFSKVIGSVILSEGGLLAKHTNEDWNYEYVLGERLYSQGRHTIQLKIEQNGTPYNIFFGCISSQAIPHRISLRSPSTVGWFGSNRIYHHGICEDNPHVHSYHSNAFAADDRLRLTFDCERKQIELFHEDTNKNHILAIDVIQAPFPWQLFLILTDKDDCIRLIPNG